MAKTVIMPLPGTFRPQGGMTKSALRKSYNLIEAEKNVFLISFSFRLDQEDHEDELRKAGLVRPDCHC